MSNRIVLSYEDNEYLPIFTSIGHNLKEKNTFLYEPKKIIDNGIYSIILNNLKYDENNKNVKMHHICLTFSQNNFIRGFLYLDNILFLNIKNMLDCK